MRILSISFLLGILFSTAFAPLNLFWIGWPALGCFFLIFKDQNKKTWQSAACFIFAFNLCAHYWLYHSIATYGELNIPISLILTLGFLLLLTSIQTGLLNLFHQQRLAHPRNRLPALLFTTLWLSFEWLKTTPLLCFPWSQLAYAASASPFKYYLPVTGILGSSALLLFFICHLAVQLQKRNFCNASIALTILAVSMFGLKQIQWTQPKGDPIRFSAIQGNITEFEKWDPKNLPDILGFYTKATMSQKQSQLIIWPEGAVPIPWQLAKDVLLPLKQLLSKSNQSVILGASEFAPHELLHNTMVILDKKLQFYRKENLVYFGENLPLRKWLEPIVTALGTPAPVYTYPTIPNRLPMVQGQAFIPLICYDIAFPQTLKQFLPEAGFIVTLSDDAWFGHSSALAQHLQIAQAQSIALARPQIVSTNNGLTALISSTGSIIKTLPSFQRGILQAEIQPVQGQTIISQLKDWYAVIFLWIISIIVMIFNRYALLKR